MEGETIECSQMIPILRYAILWGWIGRIQASLLEMRKG